jgi:uncharacterized OsmC-like protein
MSVHVRSAHEGSFSVGWTGGRSLVIDRSPEDGGAGFGFDGEQLLLLAIGASYANELFREAEKRGMELIGVRVVVECDWAGDPVRAQNVRVSTRVEAEAPEEEIMGLIHDVDGIAEVHNSLRHGTGVTLCEAEAVSMQIEARSL